MTLSMKNCLHRRGEVHKNGELICIPPTKSFWYAHYVQHHLLGDEQFMKKFHQQFRLPYEKIEVVVDECEQSNLFMSWSSHDARHRPSSPLQLLILSSLRHLGCRLTFDIVEEAIAVLKEVQKTFFQNFIKIGRTTLYGKFVILQSNYKEAKWHMKEFTLAGLP
ncbi:hypothetical protein ACHAWX_001103 [Stephanocyclus meneghinianus]